MLSYLTSGESHGKGIVTIIKGLPAGLSIDFQEVQDELKRRRISAGRGLRMNREQDKVEILSGIRRNKTLGTPLTILVRNYANTIDEIDALTKVRPGHIDLSSAMKFLSLDGRIGAERASARETVGRVIAGSIAKSLLNHFSIYILSYVTQIDALSAIGINTPEYRKLKGLRDDYFYTVDKNIVKDWKTIIDNAQRNGQTIGGRFEVIGFNIPVGLGDHTHWEGRLDARLGCAIMAIPAVKGVELGLGFDYAHKKGSQAQDLFAIINKRPIMNKYGGYKRLSNYAGGIEGGLSNGENIILRAVVKPIPTLRKPLPSVDIVTKHPTKAQVESADICAVSSASVIAEAVVAFEIARAFMNKFGADTLLELTHNFQNYQKILRKMFSPIK
jgi:chorismate synthase